MTIRPKLRSVALALAALALAAPVLAPVLSTAQAETRKPERKDKSTVYKRVLAKTDATLFDAPDGKETLAIRPFQPLYVYDDKKEGWIEVGRGVATGPEGWIRAERAVPWEQNIVVSFANPAGRERQLLFGSEDALLDVVRHESAISMARKLREEALATGKAEGVVSIEPADYVDITKNFYLLPILDWSMEEHPMTFELMRVLKLASLTLEDKGTLAPPPAPRTVGVVFVIDTTRSMQPYIEATAETVREIVGRIRKSEAGKHTRFAAIGFRDSVEAAKAKDPARDIEYRTHTFLDLDPAQTPDAVIAGFDAIHEAGASTVGYAEDAASGVMKAIQMKGWETGGADGGPIEQRYVIVISDASPKQPGDESLPPEIRDMDADSLRELAKSHDITLMAIHLKTPDGAPNHRAAEAAYTALTRNAVSGRPNYYPVDLTKGGDAKAAMRPQVEAIGGFVAEEYDRKTEDLEKAAKERELTPMEESSLAMRLAWLGRKRDAKADPLIEVWAIDRSLENPLVPALDVRLLVTKNELSTMADVLRAIVETGEVTQGEMREGEFFEMLRGALARIAQNPDALVNTDFQTLDQAVGDYLSNLPYLSPILDDITPEKWMNMGPQRRLVLDRVRSRLQLYEHFHDDAKLWTALYDGAPDGERVFAMPFEALP